MRTVGTILLDYVAMNVTDDLTDEDINEICDEISTYVFLEYKAMIKEYELERLNRED